MGGNGYIGQCPHCERTVVAAAEIDDRKWVGRQLAEMAEGGYVVLRRTVEEIRSSPFGHEDGCTFEDDKDSQLTLPGSA